MPKKIPILLIEDDNLIREMYAKIFKGHKKYELYLAESGEDGLEKMKKIKPKLIILDLIMEGLDGFGVLGKMRDGKINIPVLVATNADMKIADKALDLGAKRILRKTMINPQKLVKAVGECL